MESLQSQAVEFRLDLRSRKFLEVFKSDCNNKVWLQSPIQVTYLGSGDYHPKMMRTA